MGRLLAQRAGVATAGVLEPDPLVERMRIVTPLRRREEEQLATADTRFGLEISDVSELVRGSEFKVFESVLASGGAVCAINAGPRELSRACTRHPNVRGH